MAGLHKIITLETNVMLVSPKSLLQRVKVALLQDLEWKYTKKAFLMAMRKTIKEILFSRVSIKWVASNTLKKLIPS